VLNATFTSPDLIAFCGLDELGLEATGQRLEPGRAVLARRVVDQDEWCRAAAARERFETPSRRSRWTGSPGSRPLPKSYLTRSRSWAHAHPQRFGTRVLTRPKILDRYPATWINRPPADELQLAALTSTGLIRLDKFRDLVDALQVQALITHHACTAQLTAKQYRVLLAVMGNLLRWQRLEAPAPAAPLFRFGGVPQSVIGVILNETSTCVASARSLPSSPSPKDTMTERPDPLRPRLAPLAHVAK